MVEQQRIDSLFLKREIAKNNINKIVKFSRINLLAAFIIFVLYVSSNKLLDDKPLLHSTFPLFIIVLFNVMCILLVKFYKFNYSYSTFKIIEGVVFCYISISLIGSSFIMIVDQNYINAALFYTLIIFVAATYFIIKPFIFIIPVVISGVMVIISM